MTEKRKGRQLPTQSVTVERPAKSGALFNNIDWERRKT